MELTFTAPTRPLSINESNRMHWAARKRRLEGWKLLTIAAYRDAEKKEKASVEGKPCTIEVHLPFERAGRRDAHNYTGTVVKTIVDALVTAGLVPDDTPEWVTVKDPQLVVDKTSRVRIIVTTNNPRRNTA
jgi:hypothetical protein